MADKKPVQKIKKTAVKPAKVVPDKQVRKDSKTEKVASGPVKVISRSVNVASVPYKMKQIIDMIRGMEVEKAVIVLVNTNKKAAGAVLKVLNTAIADAENNYKQDKKNLIISKIQIGESVRMPRYRFSSRGRVNKYYRRRSKIIIELSPKS